MYNYLTILTNVTKHYSLKTTIKETVTILTLKKVNAVICKSMDELGRH
jgi:hypothetical protein